MRIIEKTLKLESIHIAIKNKIIGTPKEIAEKLKISRACLYYYIESLKDAGAEVEYNRTSQHFFYKNEFDLKLIIEAITLPENELKDIKGGNFSTFFFPSNYIRRKEITFAVIKFFE